MKTTKIFLSLIVGTTLLLNTKFATANTDSTKMFFQKAFDEVKNMLEAKQPMNFERAIFVTENAYLNNSIAYKDFQATLDANIYLINQLMNSNNRDSLQNFKTIIDPKASKIDFTTLRYTEKEKKELYRKALANWAIFTYMTDTTSYSGIAHFPFSYQINDPFGMNDWKNSQVINLFNAKSKKGNCFALVSLFKILADRLNSEAYICTAPQHIYIQHRDHKGDFYNVELATRTHPGDGTLQTLTYTYHEGIVSGISLRRLKQEKQNIALCLVNLGKSYEHKFNTRDDDFILECAELALKHDSLNLNAMLLKEQVLEERVVKYATQKNIFDINKLKLDKNISSSYKKMETQIITLYDLGYHQMPLYMQEMVLEGLKRKNDGKIIVQDRTPNPFTSIKVDEEDRRYSTLSHGLFEEVHEKKQFEQYGRFTINTDKKAIIKLESENNFQFLIDPVVFAWQIDPLTSKYPSWSPYAAFADNPIRYTDIFGMGPKDRVQAAKNQTGLAYKQETAPRSLRTANTVEALTNMDCSEFVCRVLNADNITAKVEDMTTGGLQAYLSNTDQFEKSQKAQVGDIALWYDAKTGKGHTGIVSEVDKNGNIKLVHARGAGKLSQENPNFTSEAIMSDKPFVGYFRPIVETVDGKITAQSGVANTPVTSTTTGTGTPTTGTPTTGTTTTGTTTTGGTTTTETTTTGTSN